MKINEVDKVTNLAAGECITAIAANGSLIQIPVSELGKVLAKVMPVATREQNGLMSKDGWIMRSDLGQNNLEDVGTACGYTYADGDGSGIPGPFFSVRGGVSCIQFKANYQGSMLRCRVYNQVDGVWSKWRSISFTL